MLEAVNINLINARNVFRLNGENDVEWLWKFLETNFPKTKGRYLCKSGEEFFAYLKGKLIWDDKSVAVGIRPKILHTTRGEEIALCVTCRDINDTRLSEMMDIRDLIQTPEEFPISSDDISSFFF